MPPHPLAPTGLLCELMEHPERTTVHTAHPRFGWIVNGAGPKAFQTAYRILVASDRGRLMRDVGDVWDSGKVESNASIDVPYAGADLAPHTVYHWKVRVWTLGDTNPTPYSTAQEFHTGDISAVHRAAFYPLEVRETVPARFIRVSPGRYFVDFGRAAFGTLRLTLDSPVPGREVEVRLGEAVSREYTVDPTPGGCVRYRLFQVRLQRGTHTYTLTVPPDKRNTGPQAIKMPTNIGEVMPFRYCEVRNAPGELDAGSVRRLAVQYPFNPDSARFRSSSPVLDDVWELCKYSIQATSFAGVYVDGDRERIPYEADAYINQLCHYCVDREFTMARRSHEYLMVHPTWPTEWILHSVLIAWADYLYTGNRDSLTAFYDDLIAKTLLSLAREDGLISSRTGRLTPDVLKSIHFPVHADPSLRDIVDWPMGERDGYVFKPINTVVNAFHFEALQCMARIADALGKTGEAAEFRAESAQVKEAVNSKLFDADRGVYVDGEGTDHASLHANMLPAAFGMTPPEHRESVLRFIESRGMACSVYGAQYLLEALYRAGADDVALSLLTSTGERSWAHMLYDVGSTVTLEAWDPKYKPNLDWNHAWGAAPANIIPRWLMGVRPLEPGFRKVLIQPRPGNLKHASLTVPTIRGAITVRFEHPTTAAFRLDIDLPGNMTARVVVPRFDYAGDTLQMDGVPVTSLVDGNCLVIEPVAPGRHIFELP